MTLCWKTFYGGRGLPWCVHKFKNASADLSVMHCSLKATVGGL